MKNKSLLIIGHGSKSKEAVSIFEQIVASVQDKAMYECVLGAHMELAQPSIEEAVAQLHSENRTEIIIIPYFLFNGNHIKFDIPKKLAEINKQYPEMHFKFGKPIGFEPIMADILLKRAQEIE